MKIQVENRRPLQFSFCSQRVYCYHQSVKRAKAFAMIGMRMMESTRQRRRATIRHKTELPYGHDVVANGRGKIGVIKSGNHRVGGTNGICASVSGYCLSVFQTTAMSEGRKDVPYIS